MNSIEKILIVFLVILSAFGIIAFLEFAFDMTNANKFRRWVNKKSHLIRNYKKGKEQEKLGIKPVKCDMCEEAWAEFKIKNKKVCVDCVFLFDDDWEHERLYNKPSDWRDE